MRLRWMVAVAAAGSWLACVGGGAPAQAAATCTWGGTPARPTGVSVFEPITNIPSTTDLDFRARGPLGGDCSGHFVFRGHMNAGSSCSAISFEGRARGIPGVRRFAGQSIAGVAPARLYDGRGHVVASENAQFLTNSNLTDCNSPGGLTRVKFSSVIELF